MQKALVSILQLLRYKRREWEGGGRVAIKHFQKEINHLVVGWDVYSGLESIYFNNHIDFDKKVFLKKSPRVTWN